MPRPPAEGLLPSAWSWHAIPYGGNAYILVEYGDKLALFTESGSPVTSRSLANEVLRSYSWKQVLDDLDADEMTDTVRKVEEVDSNIVNIRSLSNATVDVFDELESLGADVPLLGKVSAMDVVRKSYPGAGSAQDSIRSLNSQLNDFRENADTLIEASGRVTSRNVSSDIDGDEMDRLLRDAVTSAQDLRNIVQFVKASVSDVLNAAGDLESALQEASDTPLIGDAIGGLASTAARFESGLSDLTSKLRDFEGELSSVGSVFQKALDSATRAQEGYMARWLEEPHDSEWPPADPERRPAGIASQRENQERQDDTIGAARPSPVQSVTGPSAASESGQLLWSFWIDEEPGCRTVVDGIVYFGSKSGSVYAVDASNGELLSRFNLYSGRVLCLTIVEEVLYVSTSQDVLYALNASDGDLIWRHEAADDIVSKPAVANGLVYFGSEDSYVYALDATTGSIRWRYKTGSLVRSWPAVNEGTVFIGSWDGYLYALDARTGDRRWRFEIGTDHDHEFSPAVADGIVYVGSLDHNVYAVDATTGQLVWKYQASDQVWHRPTVVGGVTYVGSIDGYVHALDAATGDLIWTYQTSAGQQSQWLVVDDGVLYVVSFDDSEDVHLDALNALTGALTWRHEVGEVGGYPGGPLMMVDRAVYLFHFDGNADKFILYAVSTPPTGG